MDRTIVYTNSAGQSLTFGAAALHYGNNDLRDYSWDYDEDNGRISHFYRGLKELKLMVAIEAQDSDGLAMRNSMTDLFDADIVAKKPGRISIGDSHMGCYVVGSKKDNYHFSDGIMELELTLLCEDLAWTHEIIYHFPVSRSGLDNAGRTYPYGYPYNYSVSRTTTSIDVGAAAPCQFLLTIYGAATSPYIWIGNSQYMVNIDVPEGGILFIDSRNMTITMRDIYGNTTSAYSKRQRGRKGSGKYIFEPIEPGYKTLSWDNSFGFDLAIYSERSEPLWT